MRVSDEALTTIAERKAADGTGAPTIEAVAAQELIDARAYIAARRVHIRKLTDETNQLQHETLRNYLARWGGDDNG